MQAPINKELAALMQLQSAGQAIKTLLSSGVAPGTVAAQKVQETAALTQAAPQAQAMPPSGIERVLPGVGVQAAMSAQAAQPATQGDVNQLRQMMTQGIAAGADVQMAEGGIVGFSGEFGSYTPEALAVDELRVAEAKRKRDDAERQKMLEFLEQAGSPLAEKYRVTAPAATPTAETPKKKEPAARPTGTPTATTQAAPPAPASTGMIDYAKALQAMLGAQEQGFKRLEELAKPQPQTPEELAFVKRQEEEVARRRAGLDSRRQQYLDLEKLREETGRATGLQDLAAFLTRAGGARSGLAGLGRATEIQTGVDAERRKEAQAAIDRKLQYFDMLEQQRDAIEDRDVAIQQGRMDRAKAAQERVDALTKGIATLRVQSSAQMYGPTIQAGQHAADTQARIASAEKLAKDRNAALVAAATVKGMKPPPGMTMAELEKFQGMVNKEFNSQRLGPAALAYLSKLPAKEGGPSGEQLVRDITNGNIKPGSPQWIKEVEPKLEVGKLLYAQQLRAQTKYGAQPIPYSTAASLAGIAPAADEED